MENLSSKDSIVEFLNSVLAPLHFKKIGNSYIKEGAEITKKIHLQKSSFSNEYYINYGYIINAISVEGLSEHISRRIKGTGGIYKKKDIEVIINEMELINSESDILKMIKKDLILNAVPLVVKKYFHLLAE